jgi:KipI family sensor histidine kinase inhibitor
LAAAPADGPAGEPRTVVLPARYDGPDLADVARATGLRTDEVVERHASATYRVQMVGFLPGFAYLGPLPEELRLPRRATPRVRIPAGSIAVADAFTAVYPSASPGGWHLIGSVDLPLLDLERDPPTLLRTGDLVRFEP